MSEQVRPVPADPFGPPAPAAPPAAPHGDPLALSDAQFAAAYGDRYPPLPYHQLLRAGPRFGFWWALLGTVLLAVTMVLLAPLVWLLPFVVGVALSGGDVGAWLLGVSSLSDPTPSMLAYLMLTLASLIPACWFVVRVVHGVRPRWLTSVAPRMRWRWFATCLGLAVVALVATVVVSAVLPAGTGGAETDGSLNAFTATTLWFLLVVVLIVPFQAAGEEYLFRGYLTQALGGVFGSRWVAVLLPALLFALAHGLGQSVPVFFDRFAFGVVAGVLVIATGGLEAAIAMHVLNNFLAFGLALAVGDLGSSLNPTGGSWWMIPSTLTQSLVFLGLTVLVARRTGLATHATGRALVASQRRV